jgi:hypothetical protein
MNVKIPLLVLLVLAAAVGYLLGTERGRAQRDVVLVKLGRKSGEDEAPGEETEIVDAEAAEAVAAEATEPTT